LKALRALGVRVSLDDFGTGYCSLSYLQQFPVDTLKIDRSFVARIGETDGPEEIIRLLVGLARTLGLDIVAEGIETSGQLQYLAALGCSYGQGYYFSRPASPENFTVFAETATQAGEPS
jgi:EAL domain-containing protein (putative c-di-GMP-specific phosphodiesterase class I)